MTKRNNTNPCFYVDLDNELILNEFNDNKLTTDEFKSFLANSKHEFLDMNLMTQRLINFNFDFNKLKEFYNS